MKTGSHYASGIILVTVGIVGVVGSVTGELANMLAALWVPEILATASGTSAATNLATGAGNPLGSTENTVNNISTKINELNPITGPVAWVGQQLQSLIP